MRTVVQTVTVIVLLVCAGTSVGRAQGSSDADAVSKIVAMEHVWAQAYMANDPKALARILDEAFVCVGSDGRLLTKADVLADVKASNTLQLLMESMVVHLHGDTAIVTGTFRTVGVERGKPFTRRERFVDTWLFRSGQWVSLASMVTLARDSG
jgi:ketosteroid isomerase-like protein